MVILIVIIVIILLILILSGVYFSNNVIYPKKYPYEDTYKIEVESGRIDENWFNNLYKECVKIKSPYGYQLNGIWFPKANSNKTMIFSHGITYSLFGTVKYINMFIKRDFNILIYDHRNHGKSGGENTTFGYYEKYDLKACVDWVINRCGHDSIVGVHGESMGAATVLQATAIDNRIKFCIADCPYSDWREILKYRLKVEYHLPDFFMIPMASLVTKIRTGVFFKDVSPINMIKSLDTPILFIHGIEDKYIEPRMSEDMYNVKRGVKKLYMAPEADHVEAYLKNKEQYEMVVEEFLKEIGQY